MIDYIDADSLRADGAHTVPFLLRFGLCAFFPPKFTVLKNIIEILQSNFSYSKKKWFLNTEVRPLSHSYFILYVSYTRV